LELPFAGGFDVFATVDRLPLVARRSTRSREDARRHFGLPLDRPVALLSFGGYGLPSLDLATVDCAADWTVATTDRITPAGPWPGHVVYLREATFLDGGFRYEDLVAASDVVITKPGYGIIAECIASGTAMLYTSRGAFREYDLLVREMPRYLRVRFIDQPDLFGGRWAASLDALLAQDAPPETMKVNGAEVAARELAGMIRRPASSR
jgi:L-arabinokinase